MSKAILRIVGATFLLFGATLVLNWAFNRPPVHIAKLTAIKQGMTQEEVQAALGEPTSIYEDNRQWAYSRILTWSIVYVYFDEQGRFKRYEYDY